MPSLPCHHLSFTPSTIPSSLVEFLMHSALNRSRLQTGRKRQLKGQIKSLSLSLSMNKTLSRKLISPSTAHLLIPYSRHMTASCPLCFPSPLHFLDGPFHLPFTLKGPSQIPVCGASYVCTDQNEKKELTRKTATNTNFSIDISIQFNILMI